MIVFLCFCKCSGVAWGAAAGVARGAAGDWAGALRQVAARAGGALPSPRGGGAVPLLRTEGMCLACAGPRPPSQAFFFTDLLDPFPRFFRCFEGFLVAFETDIGKSMKKQARAYRQIFEDRPEGDGKRPRQTWENGGPEFPVP